MKHLFALKKYILIGAILALFASCEGKTYPANTITTTVSGKLNAANSNLELPNAKIDLVKVVPNGHTRKDIVLDSCRSDSLGNYSFTFEQDVHQRNRQFQIVCYYPNYYSTRDLTGPFPSSQDRHFELGGVRVYNPELHPYAWVRIKCDFDARVTRLDVNKIFGDWRGVSSSNPGQGEFFLSAKGNAWNRISYFLYYSDGGYQPMLDSVYCGNNDTTTFLISN